jgi:8-oxo-dGTP pyrophosphatase MutT (NUDIX family)
MAAAVHTTPLRVDAHPIGTVHAHWLGRLLQAPTPFERTAQGELGLAPGLTDFETRTHALAQWATEARQRWPMPGWRGEQVVIFLGQRPGFGIERALLRPLGLMLRSVQASVFTLTSTGPRLWIARRALSKPVDPGCLDALVAGGIAGFESPLETLRRECAEEAGIPPDLARQARPCGTLEISYDTIDGGLSVRHQESIALHELQVPEDFEPRAIDGEHEALMAMTPEQVWQALQTDRWTPDGAQATRALMARRGWWPQDMMQA